MSENKWALPVATLTAGLLIGAVGGVYYQKTYGRNANFARFQGTGGTRTGQGSYRGGASPASGNNFRGGMVVGQVSSMDSGSLTIKQSDGSSKIIILSGDTKYHITSDSGLDAIKVGTNVAVVGTAGSDGTTTASNVEINPVRPIEPARNNPNQ